MKQKVTVLEWNPISLQKNIFSEDLYLSVLQFLFWTKLRRLSLHSLKNFEHLYELLLMFLL